MEKISPAVLTFLLNATWQVALVAGVASVASRLMRSTPARFRHAVWIAALLLALALPLMNWASGFRAGTAGNPAKPVATSLPMSSTAMTDSFDETSLAVPRTQTPTTKALHVHLPGVLTVPGRLATVLLSLYAAFLSFRFVRLVRAWVVTRSLVRDSNAAEFPAAVLRVIEHCMERTGARDVTFVVSTEVAAPLTFGIAPAVVVLPEKLLRENDEAVLTSAIGHELVHIARHDYVLNLVYSIISIPLWFHPAATLIKRRIDETRELRCDELVTERLLSPTAYARSLVQLAGAAHAFRRPATVAVGIADGDILEERIMSMLKKRNTSGARRALLLAAAALVLVMPCIAAVPYALHAGIASTATATPQPVAAHVAPATQNSISTSAGNDPQEQQAQKAKQDVEYVNKVNLGFVYAPQSEGAQSPQESEARMKRKMKAELLEREERDMTPEERAAREKAIREKLAVRAKQLAELSKAAKITMQQAIDAALRQQPGTVMESSLVGERIPANYASSEAASPNPIYRVVILSGDENAPVRTIVMVSALDGTILRTAVE